MSRVPVSPEAAPAPAPAPEPRDVVVLGRPTEDGQGTQVLRIREGRVETGAVRPLEHGKSIGRGEIVKLTPRPELPAVCDVQVELDLEGAIAAARTGVGPPQVATERYRESWDRIWSKKPELPS
ncbi:MAG: hypothetical protein KF718_04480 [Polyangiaceae bacterium]|nr:hypothetical protein [Polyangiaceae bacterium]